MLCLAFSKNKGHAHPGQHVAVHHELHSPHLLDQRGAEGKDESMLGFSGLARGKDGQNGNVLEKQFVAAHCHQGFILQADHISGTEQD